MFFSKFSVNFFIFLDKSLINILSGLSHVFQYMIRNVFRRHLQLTADVIAAKLLEKGVIRIIDQIVIADSGTNKNPFHAFDLPKLSKQGEIILMAYLKIFTWFREKALFVFADAMLQLSLTGRGAEIRCRSADVVNISFEAFLLGQEFGLLYKGFVAA